MIRHNPILRLAALLLVGTWLLAMPARADELDRMQLNQLVEQALSEAFEQLGEGLWVTRVFCRQSVPAVEGVIEVVLDLAVEEMGPGRRNIPVIVLADGAPQGRIQAFVTVEQRLQVLALRRTLRRGDIVSAADLISVEMTLSRPRADLMEMARAGEVIGQMALRSAPANRPIRSEWFGTPIAVYRGDQVRVQLRGNGLSITSMAIAGQDGRVGESIQVRNPESRRDFLARVLGPGQVAVAGP